MKIDLEFTAILPTVTIVRFPIAVIGFNIYPVGLCINANLDISKTIFGVGGLGVFELDLVTIPSLDDDRAVDI